MMRKWLFVIEVSVFYVFSIYIFSIMILSIPVFMNMQIRWIYNLDILYKLRLDERPKHKL